MVHGEFVSLQTMSRLGQQVERVERVVRSHETGRIGRASSLDHFSCHRNMGARDRRECRAWVYAWIRLRSPPEDLPVCETPLLLLT